MFGVVSTLIFIINEGLWLFSHENLRKSSGSTAFSWKILISQSENSAIYIRLARDCGYKRSDHGGIFNECWAVRWCFEWAECPWRKDFGYFRLSEMQVFPWNIKLNCFSNCFKENVNLLTWLYYKTLEALFNYKKMQNSL